LMRHARLDEIPPHWWASPSSIVPKRVVVVMLVWRLQVEARRPIAHD